MFLDRKSLHAKKDWELLFEVMINKYTIYIKNVEWFKSFIVEMSAFQNDHSKSIERWV